MGITDAQKKQLDEQGCIVIPDVLSDEEIEVYRADILRLAAEEKQNGLAREHTNGYGATRPLVGEQGTDVRESCCPTESDALL